MTPEDDWDAIRNRRTPLFSIAGMGILRIALLFGSAAVALALILAPAAENYARSPFAGGLDMMATGAIGQGGGYTIRRSVLQASPDSVCIIGNNGSRSGDC
jgi:hypothetical protein